ncbi:MAG: 50S ribosomal protein L6 [Chloroflexi bacterium]|nr:50S ribosomal protein L6 [Chloroflexota bacterium]MCH7656564.1 50S ribosomal protein L6 [Chloroflexota bacterium]
MSRVGKQPIAIPSGVTVAIGDAQVTVKGSRGELRQAVHPDIIVREEEGRILVERPSDQRHHRALHGLTRALIANMVMGVSDGFARTLELVGYRVQQQGAGINMQLGFSHQVVVEPMDGITLEVEGNNLIHVRGIDKQVVGEQAARIRRFRPPDAYKGKGVRYQGEKLRLKPGKSAAKGGI